MVPVIEALAGDGDGGLGRHHAGRGRRAPRSRAGARIVNDVSGGLADPAILDVVAGVGGDLRRHALARPRRPDAVAGVVRRGGRCRRRGAPRAGRAGGRRPGRGHPRRPAGARPRARVRQDRRPQLGAGRRPRPRSPRSASRCWSAPAASRSSAACWPTPDRHAAPGRRPRGREHRAHRCCSPSGASGAIRVHEVRASRDALRVLDATARRSADERRRADHHRDRVLRPPRRLRPRAPRRPGVRDRPHPGPRHPSRGGVGRLAGHRRLREPRGRR